MNEYLFDVENIDLVNDLLQESDFFIRDITEIKNDEFSLKLERPFWEKVVFVKRLFKTVTYVPTQKSKLRISKVKHFDIKWYDDLYNEKDDHHSIHTVKYQKDNSELIIKTYHFKIIIKLHNLFKVEIVDEEDFTSEVQLRFHGKRSSFFKEWIDDYYNRKTKHNDEK